MAGSETTTTTSNKDDDVEFRLVLNHMIASMDDGPQNNDEDAAHDSPSPSSSSPSSCSTSSSLLNSSYLRLWALGAATSPWEFYSGACFQLGAVVCQFLPSIAIHVILGEIDQNTSDDDDDDNDNNNNSNDDDNNSSSNRNRPSPAAVAALVLLGAAPLLLGICDTQRMGRGKRVGIRVQCLLNGLIFRKVRSHEQSFGASGRVSDQKFAVVWWSDDDPNGSFAWSLFLASSFVWLSA